MHVQYRLCACACADRCPWRACAQFITIRRGLTLDAMTTIRKQNERKTNRTRTACSVVCHVHVRAERLDDGLYSVHACAPSHVLACTNVLVVFGRADCAKGVELNKRTQHRQQLGIMRLLCSSCSCFSSFVFVVIHYC